ncbi:hypothetical protein [Nocardia amikacinitolerans]|uniref:hypothetical protein n=1 Tax=Nocardia amikacinitolerans TaxID=756689 RepID=UPI0020A42642|nr:hypothetical protein [Nocardia amikacinitolerans]
MAVTVADAVLVSVDTGPVGFGVVGLVVVGPVGLGAGVPDVGVDGAGVVGVLEVGVPGVLGGAVDEVVVLSGFDGPGFDVVGVDCVVAGFDGVVVPGVDGVDGVPFPGVDGVDALRSSALRDGSWEGVVPGTPEVGVEGLLGEDGVVG